MSSVSRTLFCVWLALTLQEISSVSLVNAAHANPESFEHQDAFSWKPHRAEPPRQDYLYFRFTKVSFFCLHRKFMPWLFLSIIEKRSFRYFYASLLGFNVYILNSFMLKCHTSTATKFYFGQVVLVVFPQQLHTLKKQNLQPSIAKTGTRENNHTAGFMVRFLKLLKKKNVVQAHCMSYSALQQRSFTSDSPASSGFKYATV